MTLVEPTSATRVVRCRFCASERLRLVYRAGDWFVARCRECRHYSTVPWPDTGILEQQYGQAYYETRRMWATTSETRRERIAAYAAKVAALERFQRPPGRLIEVGTGTGFLVAAARERGWDAVGYDTSVEAISAARAMFGRHFCLGSIEKAGEELDLGDVVVGYHVLEHTPDPKSFLCHAHRILKPGGVLVLEVPHIGALDTRLFPWVRAQVIDAPVHLCHFTPATLQRLVEESGFTVLRIDGMATEVFHRARARLPRRVPGPARAGTVRPASGSDSWIRRLARRWLAGWAFAIYARRQP